MRAPWADRGLVAAALVVVGLAAADVVRGISLGGSRGHNVSFAARGYVRGNQDIALRNSPEGRFLPRCRLALSVTGGRLALRYDGPPCQMPLVELGRALRAGVLPTTLAGREAVSEPLARCPSPTLDGLVASRDGRVVRGTIRC